jgi:hypothetical protein
MLRRFFRRKTNILPQLDCYDPHCGCRKAPSDPWLWNQPTSVFYYI